MNLLVKRTKFLSNNLKKHATLWDILYDIPENSINHYDTNVIYKEDPKPIQNVLEPVPEGDTKPVVKDFNKIKTEVDTEEVELGDTMVELNVVVLK